MAALDRRHALPAVESMSSPEHGLSVPKTSRSELISPAGGWEALRAAAANGADAVYFGLSDFNARRRASNFRPDELPEVMGYLRAHNLLGYVTLNTLVFSDEIARASEFLIAITSAGVDAVIVQDLGLARLIRRMAPSLPIHASTQMTLTHPRGMEIAQRLGVRRVVLPRELSLQEIAQVAGQVQLELELFVHGALCVSYSGQCLASEVLGGRSANRGLCAQACRLPYQLIAQGHPCDLHGRSYPLSPQDLAAHDRIEALLKAGVRAFKIEGRLKAANYVAAVTAVYRAALDAAVDGKPFSLSHDEEADLAQSFSRGFTHGFLDGVDHQRLVDGRAPKHRGVRIGIVAGHVKGGILVALDHKERSVEPGDGLVLDAGRPEEAEPGGRVFSVKPAGRDRQMRRAEGRADLIEIGFGRDNVGIAKARVGSIVWKTDDPALRKRIGRSYARDTVARPIPLTVRMSARQGQPLVLTVCDGDGHEAVVRSDRPLERAEKHPFSLELAREHFGRLGGTPFALAAVEADTLDPVMVPKSVLNDLRRQAVESLTAQRAPRPHPIMPNALDEIRQEIHIPPADPPRDKSRLCVLVRDMDQLDAVLSWPAQPPMRRPGLVFCDFEDTRLHREAVERGRAIGLPVGLATLRIVKPGEDDALADILSCRPDAVLVRSLTALSFFRENAPDIPLVGDFSLNIANEICASVLSDIGLARLTPSHDLDWSEMAAMAGRMDPERLEVVVHHHVPMFHMEHCLFAACLSKGRDRRECGRPCRQRVELRDRVGAEHPAARDARCRNTVFSASAQSAVELLPEMMAKGIRHFRLELLRESPAQVHGLLDCYGRLLAGVDDTSTALRRLRDVCPDRITSGTLRPAQPQDERRTRPQQRQ